MTKVFYNICGLIGTIASIFGLIISVIAYKKIENVHKLIINGKINSIIVREIESIMQIREDVDLSKADIARILKTLEDIELLIQQDLKNNKVLKKQVDSIREEVKKTKNITIIKNSFKILKECVNVSEVK